MKAEGSSRLRVSGRLGGYGFRGLRFRVQGLGFWLGGFGRLGLFRGGFRVMFVCAATCNKSSRKTRRGHRGNRCC